MTSRKYVLIIVSVLCTFMILNLALWHGVIKEGFAQGDLIRVGTVKYNKPLTPDLQYSKHHTEFNDYINSGRYESFDVITIGDSFSNGGGHAYYQDYLEEKYGIRCLNMRFVNHCLEDLYVLIYSGLLDDIKPKAIIIESVERSVQGRLGSQEINITRKKAERLLAHGFQNTTAASVSSGLFPPVMISANKKFIQSLICQVIDPERLTPEVYVAELDRNFFTNPGRENVLQYYYEDLHYINNPLNADMVNRNLNNAAKILSEKNIQLIFFAGVDQYDLYYPYIIDKRGRPENNFFPEMRNVSPKDYVFIDTMKIMREAIERGEQDVYWLGDTHWSWKGIELFCDELVKYFNWLN